MGITINGSAAVPASARRIDASTVSEERPVVASGSPMTDGFEGPRARRPFLPPRHRHPRPPKPPTNDPTSMLKRLMEMLIKLLGGGESKQPLPTAEEASGALDTARANGTLDWKGTRPAPKDVVETIQLTHNNYPDAINTSAQVLRTGEIVFLETGGIDGRFRYSKPVEWTKQTDPNPFLDTHAGIVPPNLRPDLNND